MSATRLERLASRVRPQAASTLLLWTIAAFFLLFLIWAVFTRLDRTVRGPGKVSPASQLQVVSNLEGGIVARILVKTGDVVPAGAPLLHLDSTSTDAALSSSQAKYDALRVRIARLDAEVDGRAPKFPEAHGGMLGEQIGIERSLYRSRLADLASMTSAVGAKVTQSERAVAEADAILSARRAASTAADAELGMIRSLVDRGIEPRLSLVRSENAAESARGEVAAAEASRARARSTVAEARATVSQQRQDWRSKAAQELATAQAEMVALKPQLPELSARVRRTVVRSPVAGRVNRVLVTTVGSATAAGVPLVEIVPSRDTLIVEALIRPKDIAWVRLGQTARINVTAYDAAIYGTLTGRVQSISPDATVNEKTGDSHYTVRIAATGRLRDQQGHPLEIGPGMIAEVSLLGDKRSVLQYLLTPFTRLSESAFREQ